MNEHSSKKILFNKSTLFNLKAELLKKQEEVFEKKQLPQHNVENFKPPAPKPQAEQSEKVQKKSFKDRLNDVDVEELEACRKAKVFDTCTLPVIYGCELWSLTKHHSVKFKRCQRAMERSLSGIKKLDSLYDHLADGVGSSQLAGRFLVDFQTKKQGEVREAALAARHESSDDDVATVDDGDADGWTEFTDCLGRTRKCHKSDLEMYQKRDQELKRATFKDQDSSVLEARSKEVPEEEKKETPILVQTTNDYLQSLRDKWEEKEREMVGKDRDIHYQDLLFDEARIHGVGYYAFSTDEKERRKQMDELIKTREETIQAQKQTEETRKKRDEVMAARSFTTRLLEFLTKQRDEADLKAKEEEKIKKEEQEKERQKLREAFIREWDLGKDGVEGKVKKFREMTQEEYVEQQRDKRIDEFAPFQTASSSKSNYTFDDSGSIVGDSFTPAKTWSDVRPKAKTPPPPDISDIELQKGLYFSSKQQQDDNKAPRSSVNERTRLEAPPPPVISNVSTKRDIKYKNFVKSEEPTPIVNELSDDEGENEVQVRVNEKRSIDGTEIAPPPTYDYYGPIPKKVKHQKPFTSDIREAYDQGKKSLEAKSSSRQLSKDYDFTFG
ncbi:Uncharacterized protein OBRU01_24240 [Operophtera brumata]|uniref:CCDC174 alpha/beta GRSR domain-containing protein n=1 Tax=Operophtera brumata TaxID=104452 RepID=A0A0L7KMC6_OPEBR|nr:Uncharacterized protein OBRU01_24240 [Operophtera brumata]